MVRCHAGLVCVVCEREPSSLQGVSCFSYSQALEVLATGSLDHMVRLWTPFTPQRPVAVLAGHNTAVVGLATAEHSGHLFSLSQDLVSVGRAEQGTSVLKTVHHVTTPSVNAMVNCLPPSLPP